MDIILFEADVLEKTFFYLFRERIVRLTNRFPAEGGYVLSSTCTCTVYLEAVWVTVLAAE